MYARNSSEVIAEVFNLLSPLASHMIEAEGRVVVFLHLQLFALLWHCGLLIEFVHKEHLVILL